MKHHGDVDQCRNLKQRQGVEQPPDSDDNEKLGVQLETEKYLGFQIGQYRVTLASLESVHHEMGNYSFPTASLVFSASCHAEKLA